MATTNFGWTTPALGSANNVPADMASLAQQIDTTVNTRTAPNTEVIGGVSYVASGAWAQQTLSSPAYSSAPIYAWTLAKTAPFTPPSGWGFAIDLRASDGYTSAGMGSLVSGTINVRVININSSTPTIRLGWRLVAE